MILPNIPCPPGSDIGGDKPDGTAVYRRRPRRPPFLRVESDGVGVTS